MEQLVKTHHLPFSRIERLAGKIDVDRQRNLSKDQLEIYNTRKATLVKSDQLDTFGAAELAAQEMWTVDPNNPQALREAAEASAATSLAIYSKSVKLPPREAVMFYFGIDPKDVEGQLLAAKAELERLTTDYLEKGVEAERLAAENQSLRLQLKNLQDQLAKGATPAAPAVKMVPQSMLLPDDADFLENGIRDLLKPEAAPFRQYIVPLLLGKVEDVRIERSELKT